MTLQTVPQHLEPPTSDDRAIWEIWQSKFHFPAMIVADEIGLFALLDQAALGADEVARGLGLGARGTEALLGALTALGLLARRLGRFHLTPVAREFLLPGGPYYYGGLLRAYRDFAVSGAALRTALEQDRPVFQLDSSELTQSWETGELPADQAATVTAMMHSAGLPAAVGAARHGDFAGVRRLLDVGGGSGCFCIALAQRHPAMRFTVLELPAVCEVALQYLTRYGVQDRVEVRAANMFTEAWPAGHDAVLFSNIFHDWERAACLQLAQRAFDALPPGGRIYLHELLLEDTKDGPLVAATFSIGMCFAVRGKQFAAAELAEILNEAGFGAVTVTPTYGYYALVGARKPC